MLIATQAEPAANRAAKRLSKLTKAREQGLAYLSAT